MAQSQTKAPNKTSKTTIKREPKAPGTRAATPKKAISTRRANHVPDHPSSPETTVVRPKGKLSQLLAMIEEKQGATLEELSAALSWQPHTARAAISGLRKRGFEIVLTIDEDRKAYRITA